MAHIRALSARRNSARLTSKSIVKSEESRNSMSHRAPIRNTMPANSKIKPYFKQHMTMPANKDVRKSNLGCKRSIDSRNTDKRQSQ